MAGKVTMLLEVSVVVSFFLFILVILAEAAYFNKWNVTIITNIGRKLFHNKIKAIIAYEITYCYLIISLALWFGTINASASTMALIVGFGGAVALPIEVHLRYTRNHIQTTGPEFYVSHIEYAYRKQTEDKVIELIKGLKEMSLHVEDAQIAMQTLLNRGNGLTELVKEVYSTLRREAS